MRSPEIASAFLPQPKQDRSRAGVERVLVATEALLGDRPLEEITLADILKQARVSVGAFYAQFGNKDALVPCLYERYDQRITEAARAILHPSRWVGRDLTTRVHVLFRYGVLLYRRNRGLMRALSLHARAHPEAISPGQRMHRRDLWNEVAELLLTCRDEMTHPDPDQAVRFGVLMAGATFREKLLYDASPHAQAVTGNDHRLATEAALAFLSYVGAKAIRGSK